MARNLDNLRRWRASNRERINTLARQRHASNPTKRCLDAKRYRLRHPEYKPRQQKADKHRREQLRAEMFAVYGRECVCCKEREINFLTLDHVNGGGTQEFLRFGSLGLLRQLKKRGWPQSGYRILCMNCNFATRFGRPCPHVMGK